MSKTQQQILESHFGSEYYTIKEIEPHILAAMDEYASPLESRIRELEEGLREVKDAFQWTWDNMGTPHTSGHFNVPANGISLIDKLLSAVPDRDKGWVSVEDKPLVDVREDGHWNINENTPDQFWAAVSVYSNGLFAYWWIRHCVVEDQKGLCVVGDDDNEISGWEVQDVEYYIPINLPKLHRPGPKSPSNL